MNKRGDETEDSNTLFPPKYYYFFLIGYCFIVVFCVQAKFACSNYVYGYADGSLATGRDYIAGRGARRGMVCNDPSCLTQYLYP